MKLRNTLSLLAFAALGTAAHGSTLLFPAIGVTNGDPLSNDWVQSDGVDASDEYAFYSASPGYEGVSIGSYIADYSGVASPVDVGNEFTVTAPLASSPVSGGNIYWYFAITSPDLYPDLNDFSFSVKDSTASNLFTVDLINVDSDTWTVLLNGVSFAEVDSDATYEFHADFGATSGLTVKVKGAGAPLTYFDPAVTTTGKTFGFVELGASKGSSSVFGDGYLTVIPEPSSAMLSALLPAFLVLRRRR